MELDDAQQRVDQWIKTVGGGYFSPLTNMAVLTEEVGEVARIIARRYGDQVAKKGEAVKAADNCGIDPLADELADVLRVVICIANSTGINLSEAMERNLNKIYTRDKDRFRGALTESSESK